MTTKQKIQSLITKANQITGGSATDLTSAINALAAGYGQGGSSRENITLTFKVDMSVYYQLQITTIKIVDPIEVTSNDLRLRRDDFAPTTDGFVYQLTIPKGTILIFNDEYWGVYLVPSSIYTYNGTTYFEHWREWDVGIELFSGNLKNKSLIIDREYEFEYLIDTGKLLL